MASESGSGTIEIVPIETQEFETAAGWLSDPQINRWLTSEWRGLDVSSRMIAVTVRNKRNRVYTVRLDGTPCGLVGLSDIDTADRTGMIWYLLGDRAFSGRGVTSRAVGAAVRLAFEELDLASVYAWIMEDNVSSRRVLEKNGFREAGRIRRATDSGGRQVDRIYFDRIDE